jgi:putative transposase
VPVLSHRIRLDLNNVQTTWMNRCAGTSRYTFNWGLASWEKLYEEGEKVSWQKLNKMLNAEKPDWMKALPWKIPNAALEDLGKAFTNFFRRVKAGEKPGYPKFKKKGRSKEAFAIEGRAISVDGRKLRVPKLGWVKLRETLRFPGKLLSARFSKHAGHWYVSLQIDVDDSWRYPHRCETQAVTGIDLGVVDLAIFPNGFRVPAPRVLRALEKRLRLLNKELARRRKGGKKWLKTKAKIQKLHARIAAVRNDATHKLTAQVVRHFRWIGLENLNVKGMVKNHRLAKSVMDASMGEVRRQLVYKAALSGSTVVFADRWYPSSKTCSACSVVYKDLTLSDRRWTCDACGVTHDRDVNAAINLRTLAEAHSVTACRQGSSGSLGLTQGTKLPLGQESSICVNPG